MYSGDPEARGSSEGPQKPGRGRKKRKRPASAEEVSSRKKSSVEPKKVLSVETKAVQKAEFEFQILVLVRSFRLMMAVLSFPLAKDSLRTLGLILSVGCRWLFYVESNMQSWLLSYRPTPLEHWACLYLWVVDGSSMCNVICNSTIVSLGPSYTVPRFNQARSFEGEIVQQVLVDLPGSIPAVVPKPITEGTDFIHKRSHRTTRT